MLIECLIQRDGPTRVGIGGFNYDFKRNEHGYYVAEVNSRMHQEHLLSLPDFRVYAAEEKDIVPVDVSVGLPPGLDEEGEAKELPDAKRKRAYNKRKKADSG